MDVSGYLPPTCSVRPETSVKPFLLSTLHHLAEFIGNIVKNTAS